MALGYNIGGVPSPATATSWLNDVASLLLQTQIAADKLWRQGAQNLASQQQMDDAGLNTTTFPGNKTRIDAANNALLQLKTFLEAGTPVAIPDARDLAAQLQGPGG